MKDICFPLHNYARQGKDSGEDISEVYKKLMVKIGSNTLRLKGKKLYYVPDEIKVVQEKNQIGQSEIMIEGEDDKKEKNQKIVEEFDKEYQILKTETKLWPLTDTFKFSNFLGLKFSNKFPVLSLRNYFGSKIALYFYFVGFMINRLFIIGIVGVIVSLLFLAGDILVKYFFVHVKDTTKYTTHDILSLVHDLIMWLFSIYVFIWGFRITRDWEIFEKSFQIINGNTNKISFNKKDAERVKIKDYFFSRSLVTDELNTKSKNLNLVTLRFVAACIITGMIILFNIGLSMAILEARISFVNNYPELMEVEKMIYFPLQICKVKL
jgi:hypothetical protein